MLWQEIAYGSLNLKPHEFWSLLPGQFVLMLRGLDRRREYESSQAAKLLYLFRFQAAFVLSQSSDKPVDPLKVMPIPEFDDEILKIRKIQEQKQEEKAQRAMEKYKKLEGI